MLEYRPQNRYDSLAGVTKRVNAAVDELFRCAVSKKSMWTQNSRLNGDSALASDRLVLHLISKRPDAFDDDLHLVSRRQPARRFSRHADALRRARKNHGA